ncbi:MAG: FAD-binding oxidoreductase, partial [Clostridia bacterium]|nr:FAD-binding oxidoreductase [Clostridia bacterium]
MKSIWLDGVSAPTFPRAEGEMRCDVLVIGGGITGIMCADALRRAGVDYALVMAGQICDGTTSRTTAKVTVQHGLIYDKLIRTRGVGIAEGYILGMERALAEIYRLAEDIDCDFRVCDNYVYLTKDRRALEREVRAYERLGRHAELAYTEEIPVKTVGAVAVRNQACFHPLKFLYAIAQDLPIREHTKVIELMPGKARTNRGNIRYKKLIVATHFPLLNKHGLYPLKLYQHRSYVIALRDAPTVDGT